jgi:hypothetical protein
MKFKRGYLTKGWLNTMTNRYEADEYAISINTVEVDEDGDEDEEEIKSYGGYKTKEEAIKDLKKFKVKEIIEE